MKYVFMRKIFHPRPKQEGNQKQAQTFSCTEVLPTYAHIYGYRRTQKVNSEWNRNMGPGKFFKNGVFEKCCCALLFRVVLHFSLLN